MPDSSGITIAATDVHYTKDTAAVACILFDDWGAATPRKETLLHLPIPSPYVSGRFFERELPCIRAVLARLETLPDVTLVDGYVWLDGKGTPGLGGHLWESLGKRCVVVGVAKSRHSHGIEAACAVTRGRARRPLYVSAAGMDAAEAASRVHRMHGMFRIPTLLKYVDHLARGLEPR